MSDPAHLRMSSARHVCRGRTTCGSYLVVLLCTIVAALLLLATSAYPDRTPSLDHSGEARHLHARAEHTAAPIHPEQHGKQHQGCHLCRFDNVALPAPQMVVVPPLRDLPVR